MKSIRGGKSHLLRITTISEVPGRYRRFDDLKERAMTAGAALAAVAMIVALYAVMFLALSRWSSYAPIFAPDVASGPAIGEAIPWAQ